MPAKAGIQKYAKKAEARRASAFRLPSTSIGKQDFKISRRDSGGHIT
jgi:hypothetical protein